MNINLVAGQVILSVAVLMTVLLPIMYLSKGKYNFALFIMFFLIETLLVGIGWLNFWILIATIGVMAIAIAALGTNVILGKGG